MACVIRCIVCPLGCQLTVETGSGDAATCQVSGNRCSKGETYAVKEVTDPVRILTTTVQIQKASAARLPVRTEHPIPKYKLLECMAVLNSVTTEGPVRIGDVIVENILGTGINVIASRSML